MMDAKKNKKKSQELLALIFTTLLLLPALRELRGATRIQLKAERTG